MHCSGVDETATGSANFWSGRPEGVLPPVGFCANLPLLAVNGEE
jgi:hypothetical protein